MAKYVKRTQVCKNCGGKGKVSVAYELIYSNTDIPPFYRKVKFMLKKYNCPDCKGTGIEVIECEVDNG